MIRWYWIATMPVKKNVVSLLNSFKCSAYQLVDQNRHKLQSQSTYSVKIFWAAYPLTPILCMLILFYTMPFAVTLSKGLVDYYYMPWASKILSIGIASIPSHKLTIWALVNQNWRNRTSKNWCTQIDFILGFITTQWLVVCLCQWNWIQEHHLVLSKSKHGKSNYRRCSQNRDSKCFRIYFHSIATFELYLKPVSATQWYYTEDI